MRFALSDDTRSVVFQSLIETSLEPENILAFTYLVLCGLINLPFKDEEAEKGYFVSVVQ